jgi:DNA-nicking Smr family endonuclease
MPNIPENDDENSLFRQQMRGVTPLKKSKKTTPKPVNQPVLPKVNLPLTDEYMPNPIASPSIEKLIRKTTPAKPGVSYAKELENQTPITSQSILSFGLDKLAVSHQTKVLKGEVHLDARIDLHGLERFEAQDRLQRFLNHARVHHNRYLLVIHGKGSKHGETPILKQHIFYFLQHYPYVLTLQSAHPKHGGTGALYVILKKPLKHGNN